METLNIEIIDAVHASIDERQAKYVFPCLSVPAVFYEKEKWTVENKNTRPRYSPKKRREYRKPIYVKDKAEGLIYFPTGLVPSVGDYLRQKQIPYTVSSDPFESYYKKMKQEQNQPHLKGITFREDQLSLIQKAITHKRGVIQSPTGSGKTILQLGIVSVFPKANVLLLAHTLGITTQTAKEFQKYDFACEEIGGKKKNDPIKAIKENRIVVSTIQSFTKIDPDVYSDYFDIVIVDEAHHVSKFECNYTKTLRNLLAPIRFGFTATLPIEKEAQMSLEGHIGPLIGSLSIDEAHELGILAKPKIKLIKSSYSHEVRELRRYEDVYQEGIVLNQKRNMKILSETDKCVEQGKTCLIIVKKIEHGERLQSLYKKNYGRELLFVQGNTDEDVREKIKHSLIEKKTKAVICTAVWREGVDIPSLDVIINAAGGKSEIMTLQTIGRGLRKTNEKSEVLIIDFFDSSHPYLISHFGERITLYMEKGWI